MTEPNEPLRPGEVRVLPAGAEVQTKDVVRVLTVRCTPELYELVRLTAKHEGQSMNALVVECLQGLIDAEVVRLPDGKRLHPWDEGYPVEGLA